jgi:Domain of unknown function (DUF4394)
MQEPGASTRLLPAAFISRKEKLMRKGFLFGAALAAAALLPSHSEAAKGGPRACGDHKRRLASFSQRLDVVGLTTDQRLLCFVERRPRRVHEIGAVTGFVVDTRLVGIDFRPATGELYGLGEAGGIYTIDVSTGAATFKSRLVDAAGAPVPLAGASFGVDFNPTVDRLRIVSDTGQNLRANVDTGVTATDTALSGAGVMGAAYTNNDADPNTGTTLFDIDAAMDQLVIQAPPNNGNLNVSGKLNVDTAAEVGFDIYSALRAGTTTVFVRGLASLTVGGFSGLYSINLFTGEATLKGSFDADDQVIDVAIPLDQD